MTWHVGDALGYGWARFKGGGFRPYVVGAVLLALGIMLASVIGVLLRSRFVGSSTSLGTNLLVGALVLGLMVTVTQVLAAGYLRQALVVVDGGVFRAREVLSTDGLGPVVLTSLVIGAGTFVGSLLCYLPGLAVAFLGQWSLYFVVDKGLGPWDAIRASVDLVRSHLTESLVWFVVAGLVVAAGAALLGVGLLLALPVMLVGGAYTFRVITGDAPVS